MKTQDMRRSRIAWTGCIVCMGIVMMGFSPAAIAEPEHDSFLNLFWTDGAEKLHDEGNWLINYWNDLDNDGAWDKGIEPFGDAIDPTWTNPVAGKDGSCWVALAANMLASAGYNKRAAEEMYWDMILNMDTPEIEGKWFPGGWIFNAFNWYFEHRPDPRLQSTLEFYYSGIPDENVEHLPWPDHPFDFAANAIAKGHQVGLGIYTMPDGKLWHGVAFQGYDYQSKKLQITDSNRDAVENGLDPYPFNLTGPTGWQLIYGKEYGTLIVNEIALLKTTSRHAQSAPALPATPSSGSSDVSVVSEP